MVIGALVAFAYVGSARAAVMDPAAIDRIRVEKPSEMSRPSQANDTWSSLDNPPSYGNGDTSVDDSLSSEASNVGSEITTEADDLSNVPIVEQVLRDCAKNALADAAWDLWWSVTKNQQFNLGAMVEGEILKCLEDYISTSPITARGIASTFAADIVNGALATVTYDNDAAGLADWLEIVDYYSIPT